MKIKRTQIAYRCPDCGYATVGFLGGLSSVSDMLRLKCECGASSLDIKKGENGKVHLSVPCVYCKDIHGYNVSPDLLVREGVTKLPCPFSGMDIVITADEELMESELSRTADELQRIMQSLEADELADIQPSDLEGIDVAPDPGIYDSFNFLLRELDADGKVKCPCDNGEYDLRFTDDGIQVYCKSCGATHTFYALSAAMAEEYLGTDEIILK